MSVEQLENRWALAALSLMATDVVKFEGTFTSTAYTYTVTRRARSR